MKIIAENLHEHILDSSIHYQNINEGLLDDFIRNQDIKFRKRILYIMLSGFLGISVSSSIMNNISKNDKISNKIEELANESDVNEIKEQIYRIANYIKSAQEEEKNITSNKSKELKKLKTDKKKSDAIKRKAPTHMYTLLEISKFNKNDSDLKPTKREELDKSYNKYFNWAIKRHHNAPSDGYVNLQDIRLSNDGVRHLMDEEQYRNYGYRAESTGNIVTIGFGTAHVPYKYGEIVPERKAFIYFYGKLQEFEVVVARTIRDGVKKNPNMKYMPQSAVDALITYAYNVGPTGYVKSKLGQAISSGNIKKAAFYIKNGHISEKGHIARREREQELFTKNLVGNKWLVPKSKELQTAIESRYK